MSAELDCLKNSKNPKYFFQTVRNRFLFARSNPFYFDPDGILCFVGPQGSGKTLSAVSYVSNLLELYPHCKLVSNIQLRDYPIIVFEDFLKNNNLELTEENEKELRQKYLNENRVFPFNNNDDFLIYKNQDKGVIFLVDEIQLYLNSLESKNINMDVITQLSQQRKQRLHIVCTSQVFGRMAKPLREQFSNVVLCSCMLRAIQVNKLIDRDSIGDNASASSTELSGEVVKKFVWFHQPRFYSMYDTYYVIDRNKFVSGEKQKDIYSNIEDTSSGGSK